MLRKATADDVAAIQRLINANQDKLLPRTDEEILELLDTYWVIEECGEIVGGCCLEIYSRKIAEVRSLAVREDCRGKGYGELLVQTAIREAERRQIRQVFAVTSTREFFERLGFGPCLDEKYALFWRGTNGKPE